MYTLSYLGNCLTLVTASVCVCQLPLPSFIPSFLPFPVLPVHNHDSLFYCIVLCSIYNDILHDA